MARIKIPDDIQTQVIILSSRRCCMCFGLNGNLMQKKGQIAHLDQDNANHDLDNLAYLCFDHHDEYDSTTSQSKGLLESEVKHYRKELYAKVVAGLPSEPTSKPSTEPADRANLHVMSVDFEPDIGKLESIARLDPDVFQMWALTIPKPKASILVRNIGKYTASNYMIRTAIVLSDLLGPDREDELFGHRSEWQTGGIIGTGNIWYPNEDKVVQTEWNGSFQPSDWADLVAGEKVFYIVTKSGCRDQYGLLPETRSCRSVSLKDGKARMALCWAHNT
jgi:hypothetical protein